MLDARLGDRAKRRVEIGEESAAKLRVFTHGDEGDLIEEIEGLHVRLLCLRCGKVAPAALGGLDRHHPVEEETLPRLSVEVEDGDQVTLILASVRSLDRAGREQVRRARATHRPVRAILFRERHERGTGGEDGEGGGGVEGHGRLRCLRCDAWMLGDSRQPVNVDGRPTIRRFPATR